MIRYLFLHKKILYIISQTLYQNVSFKMLKELSCTCKVQSFEKDKCWYFSLSDFYLFCEKINRRLESNDTGFMVHLSIKKEVRHGYRGGGGYVFFALYTLNLPYIIFILYFHPIFLLNVGQEWLDTLHIKKKICNCLYYLPDRSLVVVFCFCFCCLSLSVFVTLSLILFYWYFVFFLTLNL